MTSTTLVLILGAITSAGVLAGAVALAVWTRL
jgi:hypothetical protein